MVEENFILGIVERRNRSKGKDGFTEAMGHPRNLPYTKRIESESESIMTGWKITTLTSNELFIFSNFIWISIR